MMDKLRNPHFAFMLESEREARERFAPGSVCPDDGRCHHRCSQESGCSRMEGCSPFSDSGLDEKWMALPSMSELARAEAQELESGLSGAAPARRSSI